MNTIGIRIKERRVELKLTQMQIHEATGISTGNLSDIERGRSLPSSSAVILLSDILNCTTDWLLKGDTRNYDNIKAKSYTVIDENLSKDEQKMIYSYRELSDELKIEIQQFIDFKNYLFKQACSPSNLIGSEELKENSKLSASIEKASDNKDI